MTVSELITKLQTFPQDAHVVIFADPGWSDIDRVCMVFGDWVAIMDEDVFASKEGE